jgi:hypothetical protein
MELMTEGLRPAQIAAIRNLEESLAGDLPRAPFTASVNGKVFRGVTLTGPYTLNADCTGSSIASTRRPRSQFPSG